MVTLVRASRRKHHIIYKTTCLVTGRYYIGMHSTDDLEDAYLGSGLRLGRSIKKYGKEQHVRVILEELPSREAASDREKELITPELRNDPMCLNCGAGGLGAVDRPSFKEETCQRLSEKAKAVWAKRRAEGYVPPPQPASSVQKRVVANTGKKRTDEQLANLQAGQQKYQCAVDPAILKERGQRAAQTRLLRGTGRGGRPPKYGMTKA